jgi:hypothetical protein
MAKRKKPAGKAKGSAAGGTRLYALEVSLYDGPITAEFDKKNPVVSRTIQIRGDQTLEDLHEAIFAAYDRSDEHLYEFQFGKRPQDPKARRYTMTVSSDFDMWDDDEPAGAAEETTIESLGLKTRAKFYYWFDFGDDWWHEVRVKAVDKEVPPGKYPKVTERVGASPPQYLYGDEEE